ncbi:MAG: hypothetical protein ACR2JO_04935 [Mycobacteriales bacterium]
MNRDRDAEARQVAQASRDAEASGQPATVDIRHGDFRDVLADLAAWRISRRTIPTRRS